MGTSQSASCGSSTSNSLYADLLESGGKSGTGLAPKTVYDVHVVMRSALKYATRIHLVEHNVALDADRPRPVARSKQGPESWTIEQLRTFLAATRHLRLYPALHLAATTGMRRGELAGLRWGDWNRATNSISIARSRQSVGGQSLEVACKTKSSRRCVDLDPDTEAILGAWCRRQQRDGHPAGLDDPIFTNTTGAAVHPESVSQLFTRQLKRIDLPTIRFHDLRHTHATLLAEAKTPIKVVSERLGHAHPGFTMATYQHVMPGMGATAACDFGTMLSTLAAPEIAVVYTDDPERLAETVRLRPTRTGGNVVTALPYDPILFERTWQEVGFNFASTAQVAIDCLTGFGRLPAEGEALLGWMGRNESRWRYDSLNG